MFPLRVTDVKINIKSKRLIGPINLEIEQNGISILLGANGSGKTTLLKAIIGAVTPLEGSVRIKQGLKIGYVPQRLNLDPTLPISAGKFMRLTNKINKKYYKNFK